MSHFGCLYFKTQNKLVSVGRNYSKSLLKTIGPSFRRGRAEVEMIGLWLVCSGPCGKSNSSMLLCTKTWFDVVWMEELETARASVL